ncbi:MAG: DUF503 domain-containing protein [Myxococcota bacterium]
MIVGVAVVELRIHESQSLKEKRGVVRRIAGRLRHRFNVSVAEVGGQETWQRAVIGLAMAGSDEGVVRRTLGRAIGFVEEMHLAEVLGSDLELSRMPLAESASGAFDGAGDEALDLPWARALADESDEADAAEGPDEAGARRTGSRREPGRG